MPGTGDKDQVGALLYPNLSENHLFRSLEKDGVASDGSSAK